jgi:hypothetical protein
LKEMPRKESAIRLITTAKMPCGKDPSTTSDVPPAITEITAMSSAQIPRTARGDAFRAVATALTFGTDRI